MVDTAKPQTLDRLEEPASSESAPPPPDTAYDRFVRALQRLPQRAWTIAAYGTYLLTAVYVTGRLWVDPTHRVIANNRTDHLLFQWFFAYGARVVTHAQNPFVTDIVNVPYKVNMMGNTAFFGVTIPLAPVTLLFGPQVSTALALVLGLTLTASAWYWVLSRHVVSSKFAAWAGGAFIGFAPGMISQAGGHPNLVSFFVLPFIVLRVIALRDTTRPVRAGVILGLLIAYQVFLNEEVLFMAALGIGTFVVAYAVMRWSEVKPQIRRFMTGAGVAVATVAVLLAYPLSVQFFGPGIYHGLPFSLDKYVTDVASLWTFSSESLAGIPTAAEHVTASVTEENAYFGWPLLVLVAAVVIWMRHRVLVRALVVTAVVYLGLAVGPTITVYGKKTGVPGPLRLLGHLPLFELVTALRYALGLIPIVGILLALACAEMEKLAVQWRDTGFPIRLLWWAAMVAALLPIAPTPLPAVDRSVPAFITSGAWKQYTAGGYTVVPVPLARNIYMESMQWSAVTGIGFRMPGGYFIGPKKPTDSSASWESPARPTSDKFQEAAVLKAPPVVTAQDKADAIADLRFWHAGVVVLAPLPRRPHAKPLPRDAVLRQTVTQLIGRQPRWTGGVWIWDVRSITGPVR